MSPSLQDKIVIITGGFGALGSSLGQLLLERGARVALLDRADAPAALRDVQNLLPLGGVDLTSADSAKEALTRVAEHFGRIDGLVNVAGGFAWETLEDGSLDSYALFPGLQAVQEAQPPAGDDELLARIGEIWKARLGVAHFAGLGLHEGDTVVVRPRAGWRAPDQAMA